MQDCLVTDVSDGKVMFQKTRELTMVANNPIPKTAVPKIGTNQKVFANALHPYQNNPIHIKGEMYIIDRSRYSGFISPAPDFFFRILSLTIPTPAIPIILPIPNPRYVSPTAPELNPYCSSNTIVKVVNNRYRYPYPRAMNIESANTIGERKSIFSGRKILRAKSCRCLRPGSSLERR
jgi:hypothetical protein